MSPSIRRAWTVACASVAACLGSAWLLAQQQPATPPPTFRSNVDIVRLDVSVLDKDRHPVRGLTAADFTIEEDGHARPIVAFAPVELPAAPAATTSTAAWTREAPRDVVSNEDANTGRLVVIAFDWSVRPDDLQSSRKIAQRTVEGLGPGDQAEAHQPRALQRGGMSVRPVHARGHDESGGHAEDGVSAA
jgi:hypothetical protein